MLSFQVVVLTGAGVSEESGIPTFRGAGGLWKTFAAQDLATPQAFRRDPSLVWEFYNYRREIVLQRQPNRAHEAITNAQRKLMTLGRQMVVITQNVDELHRRAGTENLLELHGSLFLTLCTGCGDKSPNYESPICEALRGTGEPQTMQTAKIPVDELPHCKNCGGLLRPAVVWFGESVDKLEAASAECDKCDLCLVVGTSSVVYPAALFAPQVTFILDGFFSWLQRDHVLN